MKRGKCARCRYSTPVILNERGLLARACVYILKTGKRRPCPAGKECTVYERRRARELDDEF